jgi:hypothetical protein
MQDTGKRQADTEILGQTATITKIQTYRWMRETDTLVKQIHADRYSRKWMRERHILI